MKFSAGGSIRILLLLMLCNIAAAQSPGGYLDTIAKHADWYGKKKSPSSLFVHLAKTVYVRNEMIWFAAYLLNPEKNSAEHEVISVSLINNNTQKVEAEAKYPMHNVANGNLLVPDTVAPGNYSFVAITNVKVNGQPGVRFVQPVTIKMLKQPLFDVSLTLDTLYKNPQFTRILLTARNGKDALDGADIKYFLGKDKNTRISGEAKTNVLGSYTLLIPKNKIGNLQHNLAVQVKSGRLVRDLNFDLPVEKRVNDVKFYPEGGHLVAGLMGRVCWEAKTPGGTPLGASAVIYADNKAIDTIVSDSFGMGQFYISPALNKTYTAKLIGVNNDDATYNLPKVLPTGLTIHIENAIVNDTVALFVRGSLPGKYTLLVHNYRDLFSAVQLDGGQLGRNVKISLAGIPRGINIITVIDEMQRPVAERLFFAHYNRKMAVDISVDNKEVGLRQKVNIKLKLNAKLKNTNAMVSVACVQDNRFEIKKANNIEEYYYLQNQLDNLPMKDNLLGNGEADIRYLNELLAVRGWSKYNWVDMMATLPADTARKYESIFIQGDVTIAGNTIKKPEPLVLMKDSSVMAVINTDDRGHFILSNTEAYATKNKDWLRLLPTGPIPAKYTIKLVDMYFEQQKLMAKLIEPSVFDPPVNQNTTEFVMPVMPHDRNLREVKIKALTSKVIYGANDCGDYVCRFNILNCDNHPAEPDNRWPIVGEVLTSYAKYGLTQKVKYTGCGIRAETRPGMIRFKGIYNAKEHYGNDYSVMDPAEPDYLSTLLWKHDILLNSDNEVNLSFYTSDIADKFRIVVQGVSYNDVVYGETTFDVKLKPRK